MALCLSLALTRMQIPAETFTLAWTHSVERIAWEEDYRVTAAGLELVAARVQGSGAGMEPPAGAQLQDGWWHYAPALPPLERLDLVRSPYAGDYRLCWDGRCRSLSELLGPPQAVETLAVRPCSKNSHR